MGNSVRQLVCRQPFPIYHQQFPMGNFKELHVWNDGINLSANIYHITRKEPFVRDFGLCNQIQRAAVSISSNIAEGDERGTNRESVHYFNIAKGSAAEVITQLNIAYKIGYINEQVLNRLEDDTEKIRASLKNLIKKRGGNNNINKLRWFLISMFFPI